MKKKKKSLLLAISATTPSTISTKPVAKKSPDVYVYKKSTTNNTIKSNEIRKKIDQSWLNI